MGFDVAQKGFSNTVVNKSDDKNKPQSTHEDELKTPKSSKKINNFEFYLALCLVLISIALFYLGNIYWDERYYTPDEGLGYYMGLVGGSMMLLAFGYTLFKYVPIIRSGAVMKLWLTIHLVFGILGPVLVMFHSTFRIGSVNGGIALISMGIMFLSGVMARFLYSKIHNNLDGKRNSVKQFKEALKLAGCTVKSKQLEVFTHSILDHQNNLLSAIWVLISFEWRSRILFYRLTSDLQTHLLPLAKTNGWDKSTMKKQKRKFKNQLKIYMYTLKKVALYNLYLRFFTFWRNAHVPISYMLLMSGVVHVLAVHMY